MLSQMDWLTHGRQITEEGRCLFLRAQQEYFNAPFARSSQFPRVRKQLKSYSLQLAP